MQVTVYTRHSADCKHSNNPHHRQCRCPKWLYARVDGKARRESASTRSWEKATRLARQKERDYEATQRGEKPKSGIVSLAYAIDEYLKSKKTVGKSPETIYKLEVLLKKQFLPWCLEQSVENLVDIKPVHVERFRTALAEGRVSYTQKHKNSLISLKKKHERLIGFFYFVGRHGWIASNPAAQIERVQAKRTPTDYFPRPEFDKILDATYVYDQKGVDVKEIKNNATRLRTMTLLLRWSGLALGDGITLTRDRLDKNNNLLLYRAKTGVPVYVTLPDSVADALRNVPPGPKPNPAYFFWSGNGEVKSAVKDWQRAYRRLFQITDIRTETGKKKRCFPHMFRDTFAVEYLLAGMALEEVSMLLGHTSIKTTEMYYAPFVVARQQKLVQSQRAAWKKMQVV